MSDSKSRDVIVVGGGFAGTTAARDLQQRGFNTLLLEARDRLGGRTWTTEMQGWKVEAGGTWVHWNQPSVWAEVQRYGMLVEETAGSVPDRVVILIDGCAQELSEDQFGEFLSGFEQFFAEAAEVWERPYDSRFKWPEIASRDRTSVADRLRSLDLSPLQLTAVTALLESLVHGELESASYVEMMRVFALSGFTYALFSDSLMRYKLVAGTGALLAAMASDGGFDVELEASVEKIRQTSSGVEVTTAGGERHLATRGVVVTVPMNVLGDIDFEPAVSEIKMQAASERHAGRGFKVFLEVEGDPGQVMTLAKSSENRLGTILTYAQGQESSLLAAFGTQSECLDDFDLKDWQKELSVLLPECKLLDAFGHSWVEDPLSQGTWCSYKAGQMGRFAEELGRAEGRLVFAGADHGEGWRGFIDGAIASGSRAAIAIAGSS
jgi:monoamine oxidase